MSHTDIARLAMSQCYRRRTAEAATARLRHLRSLRYERKRTAAPSSLLCIEHEGGSKEEYEEDETPPTLLHLAGYGSEGGVDEEKDVVPPMLPCVVSEEGDRKEEEGDTKCSGVNPTLITRDTCITNRKLNASPPLEPPEAEFTHTCYAEQLQVLMLPLLSLIP